MKFGNLQNVPLKEMYAPEDKLCYLILFGVERPGLTGVVAVVEIHVRVNDEGVLA